MINSNGLDESGQCAGSSKPHSLGNLRELRVDALSSKEWSYLLGLFLTDGSADFWLRKSGCGRWRVRFYLQGGEKEIAHRVAELLTRLGLRPRFDRASKGESMITVRVLSKSLFNFLPDKKALAIDVAVRERFLAESGVFGLENGIPFLAGLLDGDGSCQVSVEKRKRRSGAVNFWKWCLCQDKLMFLLDYIERFVKSLAKDEGSVRIEVARTGGHRASIRKRGVVALLDSGIAQYSWKASRWLEKVARIQGERKKYLTTGQVAAMFGVCREYVRSQLEAGKVRYVRGTGKARESRVPSALFRCRYFVPVEEANRLGEKLREERERAERMKREGMTLVQLARILGVPWNTLRRWWRRGMLQGTVIKLMGKGHRRRLIVIPTDEVERLKKQRADLSGGTKPSRRVE